MDMVMVNQRTTQLDSISGFRREKRRGIGLTISGMEYLAWATDSMSILTRLPRMWTTVLQSRETRVNFYCS